MGVRLDASRASCGTIATFFALAVFWDYMWFVFNPAYTVARFKRGNVWWFEVPWIWRFPLDYYTGIGLSIGLRRARGARRRRQRPAGPPALDARRARGADRPRGARRRRCTAAGTATCAARASTIGRDTVRTYGPPEPDAVWSGGVPDLPPLERRDG